MPDVCIFAVAAIRFIIHAVKCADVRELIITDCFPSLLIGVSLLDELLNGLLNWFSIELNTRGQIARTNERGQTRPLQNLFLHMSSLSECGTPAVSAECSENRFTVAAEHCRRTPASALLAS